MFGILKKPDEVTDAVPTPDELAKALASHVETATGASMPLSDLVAPGKRTLLAFVRHHHCGICHEFVRALGRDAFLGTLHAAGVDNEQQQQQQQYQVVVVGHGPWKGIEAYKQRSECKFDMVVDHEAKGVYRHLGLTRSTLSGATSPPSYLNGKSVLSVAAHSTYTVLADAIKRAPGGGLNELGDMALLGGDFIIDAEGKCIFCHRMRSTVDHTDVAKLSALLKGSGEEA